MLIRRTILDRIATGEVDLQFRRWTRPTVKAGGTLRTAVGMLEIVSVDRTTLRSVTATEAHRAGYTTKLELIDHLRTRSEGHVYRIQLRPGGKDPLIDLRNCSELPPDTIANISSRLARLDAASAIGPWTTRYLELLGAHPHVRAQDLAESIGLDKPTFKANVRKLKTLGLTISHSPGYELSPRGETYLSLIGGRPTTKP